MPNSAIVKYRNEDFCVTEVSLLPTDLSPSNNGEEYTLLIVRKSGYTTFEAIRYVADFFHVDRQLVRSQGLKDEDGVTEQLFSIKTIVQSDDVARFNKAYANLKNGWMSIGVKGYSPQPVQERFLHGNVFRITLRNLTSQFADAILQTTATTPCFICANYYDQQRFGLPGGPYTTHLIGKAIIARDWQLANDLYRASGNVAIDFPGEKPDGFLLDKIDHRKLNFFAAAYASFQWNNKLSRLTRGQKTIVIFDGYKVKSLIASNQPYPLAVVSKNYTVHEDKTITHHTKTRPSFISTSVYANNRQPDTFFESKYCLDLQFFLPTGSYATMLVKQFLAYVEANESS